MKRTHLSSSLRLRRAARRASIVAIAIALSAAAAGAESTSYAWVRTLDGEAALAAMGAEVGEDRVLTVNAPLVVGDRLWVERRSRLEIALPDGALVRLDGESGLELSALALAGDRPAEQTVLELETGRAQVVIPDEFRGRYFPRLDTVNATVHLEAGGSYRLASDGASWTEVVVRAGSAEVVTPRGGARLRAGEAVEINGDDWPRVALTDAGAEDALERWGYQLDEEIRRADLGGADVELRAAAGRLSRYGTWVSVGGRSAWHPRTVSATWRPFVDGSWVYLPSGYTWVSAEPWGWATSHYGGWDYVAGWGWVWFPGTVYSPAWVYWYWGPSHVGWCPTAYYTRAYSHWGASRAFRHGVYGWAGGWNGFTDWTFCPYGSFRRRSLRDDCRRGSDLQGTIASLPRGIITSDTRPVHPSSLGRAGDAIDRLRRSVVDIRPGDDGRGVPSIASRFDLPDVSDFVARRRDLADDQVRAVAVDGLGGGPTLLRPVPAGRPEPVARSVHDSRPRAVAVGSTPAAGGQAVRSGVSPASPATATDARTRDGRPVTWREPAPAGAKTASPRSPVTSAPARPTAGVGATPPSGGQVSPAAPPVRRVVDSVRSTRPSAAPTGSGSVTASPGATRSPAATRGSPAPPTTRVSPASPPAHLSPASPTARVSSAPPTTRVSPASPPARVSPAPTSAPPASSAPASSSSSKARASEPPRGGDDRAPARSKDAQSSSDKPPARGNTARSSSRSDRPLG